jgi:hypothetical protein
MRVFVSSTCYDLLDTRAEVERCLRDLGLTPILSDRPSSEFEVLPDVNSIETCLENVRRSDAFVCLLSQRYGHSLREAGFEDLSATHLEWRTARDAGKPIRLYARDRLLGEHSTWKQPGGGFKPVWVTDVKLLSFLDEHMKLAADAPTSNWVWPFRDSVELTTRLGFDFKSASNRAILNKWMADGRLPVVRPRLRQRTGPGGGTTATFDLVFVLVGEAAAFEVDVKGASATEWTRLSDVVAGAEPSVKLAFKTSPAAKVFSGEFAIRYSTSFGAVIEDAFTIAFDERQSSQKGHLTLTRKTLLHAASIELG